MNTERTRELLQPLIERPPLTDQLLQRPPFRFIFDIVLEVIQNTGFLKDVFTPEELQFSTMINKEVKVAFLRKLIAALNTDGSLNEVKASKIIAGKEAELTNLLLQKLAEEATKFWHSLAVVDNGIEENETQNEIKAEKKRRKKDKENADGTDRKEEKRRRDGESKESKERREERRKKRESETKEEREERHRRRKEEKDGREKTEKKRDKSRSHHEKKENREKKSKEHKEKSHSENKKKRRRSVEPEVERQLTNGIIDDGPQTVITQPEEERLVLQTDHEPSGTAKTEDSGIADINNDLELPVSPPQVQHESIRPVPMPARPQTSMGRPGTAVARSAPPKLKKKQIAEIEPKTEKVEEAAPVITDERKEEEENFLVESMTIVPGEETDIDADKLDSDEHGGLVKKILETKKELEAGIEDLDDFASTSVFDENEKARHKAEVENMQKAIQRLTQTVHPLARLFDYAQEDMDTMVQEMNEWRLVKQKSEAEIQRKSAKSQSESENLLMTLKQLDDEIKEKRSAIARIRASIIENETKIQILLNNL